MFDRSPFPDAAALLRTLLKAFLIAGIINAALVFSRVNIVREIITLNTWDLLDKGRSRLAYPSDFQNGQLPLEALLAAHEISIRANNPDEYRVVLLGESGIAGWGVSDEQTVSAQLTAQGVMIGSQRVVAYNLGYPQPGVARDLLILDAAMPYDPDLIIWFVTPAALDNDPDPTGANRVFYEINRERLHMLAGSYPLLEGWYSQQSSLYLSEPAVWESLMGIRDQELLPIWLNSLFYPWVPPDLGVSDRRIGLEPVPQEARYRDEDPGFTPMPNETWQILRVGCQRATNGGAGFLIVNEPISVGALGSSEINYNAHYQRALYDRYRLALAEFTRTHGVWYADLWDVIPAAHFTDTPIHADGQGYGILSAALADVMNNGMRRSICQ